VFEREKITLATMTGSDSRKNVKHRRQKFVNNELRTVVSIDDGKIMSIKARPFAMWPLCIWTKVDKQVSVTCHILMFAVLLASRKSRVKIP
jgi:hypothetical protein